VASALPRCRHAIEIDLSENGVGDAGALALAAALAAGGAPELLTLDLRGNGSTLTSKGIEALRAVKRKGLMVLADEDGDGERKAEMVKKKGEKRGGNNNDKPAPSSPVVPVSPSSPPSSSSEDDDDDDDEEGSSGSGDERGSDGEESPSSSRSSAGGGWSTGSASSSPFSPSSPSSLAQSLPPGEAVERLIGDARKALTATAKKKKKAEEASRSSLSSSSAPAPAPILRPRAAAAALFAAGAALAAEAAALAARPGGGLGGATVTVFGTAMRMSSDSSSSAPAPAWPPPAGTRLSGLPPGARAAAEKAPATLARALDTPPSDGLTSDDARDAGAPRRKLACGLPLAPGVGTHRVAAAALVARLLALRCPDADARLAASGALPKVLALALRHGHCSALQAHALAALRAALESPCEKLWMPLFAAEEEEGEGGGQGEAAGGGGGSAAAGAPPAPPPPLLLPAALALVVTEATASLLPGKRPTGHAFAVAASAVLLEVSGERRKKKSGTEEGEETDGSSSSGSSSSSGGDGSDNGKKGDKAAAPSAAPPPSPATPAVRAALSSCPRWLAAAEAGGPLALVLEEQEGDLCGPRPSRDPPPRQEESFFGGGGGGRIDGQQLLALLRSMQQL